jgi:NADH:ubiquinone oxidoreductase subunit 5 (subunit L)/multisubunit Na+/H+ antiporter MnhA subunit
VESTVNTPSSSRRSGSLERHKPRDRLAAGFLIGVMAIGSPILWVGVPTASSWAAAQLTADQTTHLQITVPLVIAGMVLFARFLFWVNKLYLRIVARGIELEPEDEEGHPRFMRGPLEPILVFSLVIALIALTVWFFAFAENPSHQVF